MKKVKSLWPHQELLVNKPQHISRAKTFVRQHGTKVAAFGLFIMNTLMLEAPQMVSAASDLTPISTSLSKAETPTVDLAKAVGKFATLVCIVFGAAMQYFGREFSAQGKKIWFAAIAGTAIIWNAVPLRDFIIGLF